MRRLLAAALVAAASASYAQYDEDDELDSAERSGQAAEYVEKLRRAVAAEAPTSRERVRALHKLAGAENAMGNVLDALQYAREAELAAHRGAKPAVLHRQVSIYVRLDDLREAEARLAELARTVSNLRRTKWWAEEGDRWTAYLERARGRVLVARGKYGEAEQAATTALAAAERFHQRRMEGGRRGDPEDLVTSTRAIESSSKELDKIQQVLGKLAEAELTARRTLQLTRARVGEDGAPMAAARSHLATVLVERGRYAEAEREAGEALRIAQRQRFAPGSRHVKNAHEALGAALVMQQRWEEAVQVYGRQAPQRSAFWAMALIRTGRFEPAIAVLERNIARLTELEGKEGFDIAMTRGMLGVALERAGRREAALAEFRAAVPVLIERAYADQKQSVEGPARIARLAFVLEGYLRALERDASASAEMFRVADFARGGAVQRALALGAARATVRDPNLAALIEEKEALELRIVTLSGTLADLLNAPADKRLDGVIGKMREDLAGERSRAARLAARIEREHREFGALTQPRPVSMEDARAALRPGSALVSVYVAEDRAYVWALASSGARAMAVRPVSAAQLAGWVGTLRKSLDPGLVEKVEDLPPFDLETAHRLYGELLEPVRSAWEGARTLVVIPHRALAHLPFGLLVTQPTSLPPEPDLRFAGYRQVPWLAARAAVVQLPAATSLVTLARLPRPKDGRRPFIGFGDPIFTAEQAQRAMTRGIALRNLDLPRTSNDVAPAFGQLPALPDTREEIRDIGRLLGADPEKEIVVGLAANEERVRKEELRSHRVIAFATHGLVPGDLEGLEQPALALSHPALARVAGDGLLDMTEILGLRLDADWVVLSACNTAAAGSAGEEALSGLGRAFFYAGARAILVSNWPVETVSARLLTTEVFRRQAADPALTRAQALREAMLHVLHRGVSSDSRFAYAHPLFWAPFSLVGDGG